VLPFDGDPDDAICAGWHGTLIEGLQAAEGLTVLGPVSSRAYTAFAATTHDAATRLGISAVLEGEVERTGAGLNCSARLMSVPDGHVLWSRAWDVGIEDMFTVYSDIQHDVLTALGVDMHTRHSELLHREPTVDLVAWASLMTGGLALAEQDDASLPTAARAFEAALERDNLLAPAWAGLAACHREAMEVNVALDPPDSGRVAHDAATRALEINGSLPSALVTLAVGAMNDWDFDEAAGLLAQATAAAPGHAAAHRWAARLSTLRGDLPTALASADRAVTLEPLSDTIVNESGIPHALAGNAEEARDRSSRVVHRNPENFLAYFHLGRYAEQLNRMGEAVTYHRAAVELSGRASYLTAFLGLVLVRVGDRHEAEEIAHDLERKARRGSDIATCLGALLIRLGREDEGLAWLESALDTKEDLLLLVDTPWLSLPEVRETARFRALIARLPVTRRP